ncbi:MAG: UDP-N-acetylmuramoylalanine--D-glutamate ligase [Parcubacteria group bacterium Gr01-1014_107]|nr:MAG: UDP-N-acetylmuramoylalanine--D-glutamate ligase [Parcubacteria group bacterium Gr01-1014_107]
MRDHEAYFKGEKITVMGLGLLGRGVGDVKFLAKCGAILTITDLKPKAELKESLEQLRGLKNIKFVLGKHRLRDFRHTGLVLKAAGVPLDSPFVREARRNKIPVEMSTALFAKLSPATIVGVTGTRGKSTVSAMIFRILKAAGRKAFLGGNTRGVSTLAHLSAQAGLPKSSKSEIAVLELDSWQLQGFGEARLSPLVSIFTTFLRDHLIYYKGNLKKYLEDKANIFKYQDRLTRTKNQKSILIVGQQAVAVIKKNYPSHAKRAKVIRSEDLPRNWKLKIPGEHNRYNAALALAAAKALGIREGTIKKALEDFKGVEGRLELVREAKGVRIYNDTTATTPDATLAALKALGGKKLKIVLIMGGSDKGLDFSELLEALPKFCKAVVMLPGTGTEKIKLKVKSLKLKVIETPSLKEAVKEALRESRRDDIILFSPAFASFGPLPAGFKNEFDRGDQFVKIISGIK